MEILIGWLISALVILSGSYLFPDGIQIDNFTTALVTALVLGIINAFLKPILLILTLPINLLTLGLFTLVINAGLIMLTSSLVPGFHIASFWWALLFSLFLSFVNFFLHSVRK